MNHTTNYQLNQWEAQDKVRRLDFNADNAKIDAAIKAVDARVDGLSGAKADASALAAEVQARTALAATVPQITMGTYTGDGTENRLISLPFTPKAVLVVSQEGRMRDNFGSTEYYTYGGLALTDKPAKASSGTSAVSIQPGGFQVSYRHYEDSSHTHHYTYSNDSGKVLHYLAIG